MKTMNAMERERESGNKGKVKAAVRRFEYMSQNLRV